MNCLRRYVSLAVLMLAVVPSARADQDAKPAQPAAQPTIQITAQPLVQDKDYQLYRTLAEAIDEVERNYVNKVDRRELIEAAIRGVLQKLDPHSAYVGPEELARFRTTIQSEFGGIGIQVTTEEGQLKVLSPIHGTPAHKAGILAGDRILEIDGTSTSGMGLDEAIAKLKGAEGSSVTLLITHPGKETKEKYTLKREKIHINTVLGERRLADGTWDFWVEPNHKVAYVRLVAFSRDTASELRQVLQRLTADKMQALILDLRFNPGGLLNAAIEVSDLFVLEGRIVSVTGRNSVERAWDAHQQNTYTGFPMVVLVNRFSASASEIVAACLQDHKRATILGERSWGKGSVQSVVPMEEGRSALKLTTSAYRRPNGQNIHRFPDAKDNDVWGVVPDPGFELRLSNKEMIALMHDRRQRDILQPASTPSDPTHANREETTDRQLQKAIAHLLNRSTQ